MATPEESLAISTATQRPIQFGLTSLLVLTMAVAIALGVLFVVPDEGAGIVLLFLGFAVPAALAVVAVYGRGYQRTFCLGALFPCGACLWAVASMGRIYAFGDMGMPMDWRDFAADYAKGLRALTAGAWIMAVIVGMLSVMVRFLLEPHPSGEDGGEPDETPEPAMHNPGDQSSRVPRSQELYAWALELIPGGTQLVSRRPTRFALGVSPIYAASAKGARFRDVDGHEYIDWVSGIGAIILGYADAIVDDAVREQIGRGTMYSVNHELEIELAEELVRLVPCRQMVRYAKCGGEACAMAVRIARGATGRDKILFCGYHGWHDWYLAANLDADASLDPHLFPGIEPIGVPRALAGTAIPFPYGDLAALGERLDENRGQVAAVIMEPLRSEEPPAGYLAAVARLCGEHGVILIFDEVSTGFRASPGGVEPVLGVTPDMAVFAKSISNGYPMAAVVGQRDVMEPSARMFISSTYWSDCIGLRAALTTLGEIERRGVPAQLDELGAALKRRLNEAARDTGLAVTCGGINIHPHLEFQVEDLAARTKLATLYIQEMAKRGCHTLPAFYLNAAQRSAELDETIAAARETFGILKEGLDTGTLDRLLECEPQQESFRRIVR